MMERPARKKAYDITRTLGLDVVAFPGDPAFRKGAVEVSGAIISNLSLSSHTGTHIDAPRHLGPTGKTLDSYPIKRFCLDAYVLHSAATDQIPSSEVTSRDLTGVQAVLFRTQNESIPRSSVAHAWVSLSVEAAASLAAQGVTLVGIDYLSIDASEDGNLPVHRTLLGADVLILEDIDLSDIPEGRYRLVCLPLRILDADGAPCRAILES
jgi:arylformamidase